MQAAMVGAGSGEEGLGMRTSQRTQRTSQQAGHGTAHSGPAPPHRCRAPHTPATPRLPLRTMRHAAWRLPTGRSASMPSGVRARPSRSRKNSCLSGESLST